MTSPAAAQLNRIVQMVAELTRREREGKGPLTLAEIAEQLGVSTADVERDLRTLTAGGDSVVQDWLGSLSVIQEGDRVMVSSQGPFRRPIRLTPEEILAIQVGLAAEPEAQPLTRELAALLKVEGAERWGAEVTSGPDEARVAFLARRALSESRCLQILYAGSRRGDPEPRVIEIQQVVRDRGHTYLVAWCRRKEAARVFRADRVLDALLLDEPAQVRDTLYDARDDGAVFSAPDDAVETVSVRFSPSVARWLFEEHPAADRDGQGGVTIRYDVADPAWLVRTVLQYGAEAEVVEPGPYRELMRSATSS